MIKKGKSKTSFTKNIPERYNLEEHEDNLFETIGEEEENFNFAKKENEPVKNTINELKKKVALFPKSKYYF